METQPEKKQTANEKLGVEILTPEEIESMSAITAKLLFKKEYHKSDAVLSLLKLFKVEDTNENRRFCLAIIAFGAAAESANRKMEAIALAIGEMLPICGDEEK